MPGSVPLRVGAEPMVSRPSLRQEMNRAHEGLVYLNFRCTGSCGTEVVALSGCELWCGQLGCRGRMRPGRVVSTKRLIRDHFKPPLDASETPPFEPQNGAFPHRTAANQASEYIYGFLSAIEAGMQLGTKPGDSVTIMWNRHGD